jgi:hypothetical protein
MVESKKLESAMAKLRRGERERERERESHGRVRERD